MGQPILSHPFRVTSNGAAATVDQDSDQAAAEQIAVLALTRPGERPMTPTFAIADAAFTHGLDLGELDAAVSEHGPPVQLMDLVNQPLDDGTYLATVSFA